MAHHCFSKDGGVALGDDSDGWSAHTWADLQVVAKTFPQGMHAMLTGSPIRMHRDPARVQTGHLSLKAGSKRALTLKASSTVPVLATSLALSISDSAMGISLPLLLLLVVLLHKPKTPAFRASNLHVEVLQIPIAHCLCPSAGLLDGSRRGVVQCGATSTWRWRSPPRYHRWPAVHLEASHITPLTATGLHGGMWRAGILGRSPLASAVASAAGAYT